MFRGVYLQGNNNKQTDRVGRAYVYSRGIETRDFFRTQELSPRILIAPDGELSKIQLFP